MPEVYDTDTHTKSEKELDTETHTLNHIDTPVVNDVTISSDSEITTIYDIATNTIINMYNFLYDYSEYCIDHNMV
jgi:hypothetical protein